MTGMPIGSDYARAASKIPGQQMRYRIATEWLVGTAGGDEARILDIGSGQGDLVGKVTQLLPKAACLGFELSESGVQISKKKGFGAHFHFGGPFPIRPETLKPFEGLGVPCRLFGGPRTRG